MSKNEILDRLKNTVKIIEGARIEKPKSMEDMRFNLGLNFSASMIKMDIYLIENENKSEN
jgi:hypothetical protein